MFCEIRAYVFLESCSQCNMWSYNNLLEINTSTFPRSNLAFIELLQMLKRGIVAPCNRYLHFVIINTLPSINRVLKPFRLFILRVGPFQQDNQQGVSFYNNKISKLFIFDCRPGWSAKWPKMSKCIKRFRPHYLIVLLFQWVSEGSPSHSTPIKVDSPNQFVPLNTNPKEFKKVQKAVSHPICYYSQSSYRVNLFGGDTEKCFRIQKPHICSSSNLGSKKY